MLPLFICAGLIWPSIRQTAYCTAHTWGNTPPTRSLRSNNMNDSSYVSLPTAELAVPDSTAGHKTTIVPQDKVCLWPRPGGGDGRGGGSTGFCKDRNASKIFCLQRKTISWTFSRHSFWRRQRAVSRQIRLFSLTLLPFHLIDCKCSFAWRSSH